MSDYTIRYEDYQYEPYQPVATSSRLYCATPKSSGKRYLIKCERNNCGCNEFMFARIAAMLGLHTPECRLFASDGNTTNNRFRYAAAIEFFEDATVPPLAEIIKNQADSYQFILSYIIRLFFADDDRAEFLKSKDGRLISLDFSEAFQLSDVAVSAACSDVPNHPLLKQLRDPRTSPYLAQLANTEECFVKDGICTANRFVDILYDCCNRFMDMRSEDVEDALNALGSVYPSIIVDYFRGFLGKAKEYAKYLLD